MSAGRTAAALATGALFKATGSRRLGRRLVGEFVNGDEDTRTAAGILLVRARGKSLDVIAEALDAGQCPGELMDVLASIEDPGVGPLLDRIAADPKHPARLEAEKALRRRERRGRSKHDVAGE